MKSIEQEKELEDGAAEFAKEWALAANAPARRTELLDVLQLGAALDSRRGLAFLARAARSLSGEQLEDLAQELAVEWVVGDELQLGTPVELYREPESLAVRDDEER